MPKYLVKVEFHILWDNPCYKSHIRELLEDTLDINVKDIFIEKVSDNVEINYTNRLDC